MTNQQLRDKSTREGVTWGEGLGSPPGGDRSWWLTGGPMGCVWPAGSAMDGFVFFILELIVKIWPKTPNLQLLW